MSNSADSFKFKKQLLGSLVTVVVLSAVAIGYSFSSEPSGVSAKLYANAVQCGPIVCPPGKKCLNSGGKMKCV